MQKSECTISGKNKRIPKQREALGRPLGQESTLSSSRSGTDLRRNEDHHRPTKRQKTNRNGTVECWTPPSLSHRDGPWTTRDNERVSMKLITALLRSHARGVSSPWRFTPALFYLRVFFFNCRLSCFRPGLVLGSMRNGGRV